MLKTSRLLASLCIAGGAFAAAAVLHGQTGTWQPPNAAGEGQNPIPPVYQEPHHRQLLKFGQIRLIELQIPPGDSSWFHMHDAPVFYLTVADSQTRTQILGLEWGARRGGGPGRGAAPAGAPGAAAGPRAGAPAGAPPAGAAPAGAAPAAAAPAGAAPAGAAPGAAPGAGGPPAGARAGAPPGAGGAPGAGGGRAGAPGGARTFRPRLFMDISYAEQAVTHRIENNGTGMYRALGVISETGGGDETVTEEAAGFTTKAEGNLVKYFRVHRVALGPGEKTSHQHKAPVVILQDSEVKGTATGPMSFEFYEPGSWAIYDAGARHEIANTGTGRLEVLEVEVRRK